ncbi:ABC-F family ATP-binding cassette domain-containing protein [Flammeovirga kamogawensis]|uniref:ABC-F family ATP-binding cassette domain-containing protein n=1 Tax=Flammeovirga kamogawensis TaxID=373891 RepID=A0ABX8GWF3_9BACT|nr:ABC-F family ATP-binding cassette domain-containing protein [Flammeovirga kamogawensis]MBB6461315.1 ATP-binding cassette subfamily F protein uup [Flammeovirga kamogawensis]QWG07871.1 ABC-F family ATP-binding cassette domain-containing protein [Flammeovirga kamogawensis]TRX69678.1 ABC-F family ATP-binding cassette domain-containing protein [Flammeovirga kamogawensis]
MNLISVDNATKYWGEKPLFENISFGIQQGQKVALVAKNGGGKSTLLNSIVGKEPLDGGAIAINKDVTVGLLEQDPAFDPHQSVLDYVLSSDSPILKAVRNYEEALADSSKDYSDQILKKLDVATAKMEELKAWDAEARVKQILTAFKIEDLSAPMKSLSGGQKKRVALSKILIEEPNLLILDEPTNHLDLDMIEWLEEYLTRSRLSLLLVTHDRYFLDRICNEIIELTDSTIYTHKGNYSYFIEKKAEREANEAASVDKAKNLMRKELDWVRRMPKARGTKQKFRMDAFQDLKKKANSGRKEEKAEISVNMSRLGKKILEFEDVYKSFADKKIVEDFSYVFKRRERVGIVGDNGVGKSTFLNMLTGKEGIDSGDITKGETIVYGYYTQSGLSFDENAKVIDIVRDITEDHTMSDGTSLTPSQLLQRFLFEPEQQHSFVSTLSGGERKRLYLCTILLTNPNFLILDEPTNDLDLATLSVLEDFLEEFQGCVIVVTHDRYFMDKLVDHLFVFEGQGKIKDFNGKYSEYREYVDEQERLRKIAVKEERDRKQQLEKKVQPKTSTKKLSYKEKIEYEALEKEIEVLETEKETIEAKLSDGSVTDVDEIREISERLGKVMEDADEKMMRWMELDEIANG